MADTIPLPKTTVITKNMPAGGKAEAHLFYGRKCVASIF
jgi:hypothetical protein